MKNESLEAEKAELIQSVKALYIPLSLFLACVIMAAGVFLIYNLEPVGWAFVAVSGAIMASAFLALIRFQNRLRANGVLPPSSYDDDVIPPFEHELTIERRAEFEKSIGIAPTVQNVVSK